MLSICTATLCVPPLWSCTPVPLGNTLLIGGSLDGGEGKDEEEGVGSTSMVYADKETFSIKGGGVEKGKTTQLTTISILPRDTCAQSWRSCTRKWWRPACFVPPLTFTAAWLLGAGVFRTDLSGMC